MVFPPSSPLSFRRSRTPSLSVLASISSLRDSEYKASLWLQSSSSRSGNERDKQFERKRRERFFSSPSTPATMLSTSSTLPLTFLFSFLLSSPHPQKLHQSSTPPSTASRKEQPSRTPAASMTLTSTRAAASRSSPSSSTCSSRGRLSRRRNPPRSFSA